MAESAPPNPSDRPPANEASSAAALEELRRILFGQEQTKLSGIEQRLSDPTLRAEDVGKILPQAFARCPQEDGRLSHAMTPAVELALKASVKRNPGILTNAIFPVIGPAIRKSIAESLRRLVQALNYSLENSFSWRGLQWRIESWRTGRPFAEVVLCRTLLFRVEQVFLIHKPSGLLLQHVIASELAASNEDIVSGMLTAVRDFVRDSFKTEAGEDLDKIQVGDLEIWIEDGPSALIAAVIRGQAPLELRQQLQTALEKIHHEEGTTLAAFDGEDSHFETIRPLLEDCLQARAIEEKKRALSLPTIIAATLVIVLLLWWGGAQWRQRSRQANLLEKLKAEPGFVVIESHRQGGKFHIAGLRDPLAADPGALAGQAEVPNEEVVFRWEPYLGLTPEMILRRARNRLKPPAGIELEFHEGKLVLSGVAPLQWWNEARVLAQTVPGVERVDISRLSTDGAEQIERLANDLKSRVILFEPTKTEAVGQEAVLTAVAEAARRMDDLSRRLDKRAALVLTGHSDRAGAEGYNAKLSLRRAEWVRQKLVAAGVASEKIETTGVGSSEPAKAEARDPANRRVSFSVRWRP